MQTFDDVLSQLVTLLRRSDAGGFVPRPATAAHTASRRPVPAAGASSSRVSSGRVVSYRDAYRCPASSWGEGGYVPETPVPGSPTGASASETTAESTATAETAAACRPQAGPSVRMPFRLFDDD